MYELKRISAGAIAGALEKALRYRLLNEPLEAESICRDILAVDADHQEALTTLVLAITDQFESRLTDALNEAKTALAQIQGEYEQAYYEGIIHERWANAQLARNMPAEFAIGWFREAMRCYEMAEQLSPPDVPDAVLRWNTCARFQQRLETHQESVTEYQRDIDAEFGGDVPTPG